MIFKSSLALSNKTITMRRKVCSVNVFFQRNFCLIEYFNRQVTLIKISLWNCANFLQNRKISSKEFDYYY